MLAVLTRGKYLNSVVWKLILPYVCMTFYGFQSFPFSNVLIYCLHHNTRIRTSVLQFGKLGLKSSNGGRGLGNWVSPPRSQSWPKPGSLYLSPISELDPGSHMEGDGSQSLLPSFFFSRIKSSRHIQSAHVMGKKELDRAGRISINHMLWGLFSLSSYGRVL